MGRNMGKNFMEDRLRDGEEMTDLGNNSLQEDSELWGGS